MGSHGYDGFVSVTAAIGIIAILGLGLAGMFYLFDWISKFRKDLIQMSYVTESYPKFVDGIHELRRAGWDLRDEFYVLKKRIEKLEPLPEEPKEPEMDVDLEPHWPAIFKDRVGSIGVSIEIFTEGGVKKFESGQPIGVHGIQGTFIRLAKEYPPIYLTPKSKEF